MIRAGKKNKNRNLVDSNKTSNTARTNQKSSKKQREDEEDVDVISSSEEDVMEEEAPTYNRVGVLGIRHGGSGDSDMESEDNEVGEPSSNDDDDDDDDEEDDEQHLTDKTNDKTTIDNRPINQILATSNDINEVAAALASCLRGIAPPSKAKLSPTSKRPIASSSRTQPTGLESGINSNQLYLQTRKWYPDSKSLITVVEYSPSSSDNLSPATSSSSQSEIGSGTTKAELDRLERIMKKSKLNGIEKLVRVEKPASTSLQKKLMRAQRQETAGKGWFGMARPEMTEELKQELKVLQLRGYVDPKRFYKKSQSKTPEYFEIGHVETGAADFYSESRTTKKQKKLGFVDELLQDQEYRKYAKRKYREIQEKHSGNGGRRKKRAKR